MNFRQRFHLFLLLVIIALKDIYPPENWRILVVILAVLFLLVNGSLSPHNGAGKE